METSGSEVSTRELRNQLSEVIGRAKYGGERIKVTKNGKPAAVIISVEDFESLERYEMEEDVLAYREAKEADDGVRVPLSELLEEFTN